MNKMVVKTKSGTLYEVVSLIHAHTLGERLYSAYRLSEYDGMPIGSLVHLIASELIDEDAARLDDIFRSK